MSQMTFPDEEGEQEEVLPEDRAAFMRGLCKCEHEDSEHGWAGCEVEGCECEANWEY